MATEGYINLKPNVNMFTVHGVWCEHGLILLITGLTLFYLISKTTVDTDTTINMTSIDQNRFAKCSIVVLEVFLMIMQDLMVHTGTEAKTLYNAIMRNGPFRKKLNISELDMVDTLQTDAYTKIDASLSYKIIINFFQLTIPPPSRQWGANPVDDEKEIGEDIERIRRARNSFVHRVNAFISEPDFDIFFDTFIEVGNRIDAYLNNPSSNRYAHTIEKYKTCSLDPDTEKKLLIARENIEKLEEKYRFDIGNQGTEIHIWVGKSTDEAIKKIKAEKDRVEGYTKLKIIIHEVDNSDDVVRLINSVGEGLNSENINVKGAQKGSIILFIDVKNKIVLDDVLFQSEVSTFIQSLFKFCNLTCHFNTQTYAVIASAAEEFEDLTINLEEAGGTCLVGNKGHVVVDVEVKNKTFHSPDSLNRTLKGFFKTLVMKGNGQNILGKTDVYAELVKSENSNIREESFNVAQTPVKYHLPVSVTLRKEFEIKMLWDEKLYIENCLKIGNDLMFTDYCNDQLIIFNVDGTVKHSISLSYTPYFITEVDSNTVAVSCSERTILIINISTCDITSTIQTSDYCYGISYNDKYLYVVIGHCITQVMDLAGKVICTIPLPSNYIDDITVDRGRLVCIDFISIYCCSLDGKLIRKFKMDKYKDIRRVTTDNERNIYVTDKDTNTVVVVSHHSDYSTHYRELLTDLDGLDKPCGIHFDKKENILLICNFNYGKAFLFDVKKNQTPKNLI